MTSSGLSFLNTNIKTSLKLKMIMICFIGATRVPRDSRIESHADSLSSPEAPATSPSKPLPLPNEMNFLQKYLKDNQPDPEVEKLAAASSINRVLLDVNAIPTEN